MTYSHVDPILFIRFVRIRAENLPADLQAVFRAPSRDSTREAWMAIRKLQPRTSFHEAYHSWQGIQLPFLHRYAVYCFRLVLQVFDTLAPTETDHRAWKHIYLPEFHRLEHRTTLVLGESLESYEAKFELSPLDIMEGVTSLIEWQVEAPSIQDIDDVSKFDRWRKRRPVRLELFNFVAAALGSRRYALMATAAVGSASMYTSEPSRALSELLRAMQQKSEASFHGSSLTDRALGVFALLESVGYDAPPDASDNPLDTRLFRISPPASAAGDTRSGRTSHGSSHPFLTRLRERFVEQIAKGSEAVAFAMLSAPRALPERYEALEQFVPSPLSIVRIDYSDGTSFSFNYTSDLGVWMSGDALPPLGIQPADDETTRLQFRHVAAGVSIVYGVVRRATGAFSHPEHRTCSLAECPEWSHNYCNSYVRLPNDYKNCRFLSELDILRQVVRQRKGSR